MENKNVLVINQSSFFDFLDSVTLNKISSLGKVVNNGWIFRWWKRCSVILREGVALENREWSGINLGWKEKEWRIKYWTV